MGTPLSSPGPLVTLVEAGSFCLSDEVGDVAATVAGGPGGLFVADRRLLARLALTVNGGPLRPVDHHVEDPGAVTFVGRALAGETPAGPGGWPAGPGEWPDGPARGPVVVRRRTLGAGLRDEVEVRNVGEEPTYVEVEVTVATDLADLALARLGGRGPEVEPVAGGPDEVVLARGRGRGRTGCRVVLRGGTRRGPDTLRWEAIVPGRGRASATVVVAPIVEGAEIVPAAVMAADATHDRSARALVRWHREVPRVVTDHPGLRGAVARSTADLGALRVVDPEFPERAVPAAASPWHRALHGRDALLASWMSLIVDPGLALGTLETLARFQGVDVDPRTEEEPGRIPARLRFGTPGFGPDARGPAPVPGPPGEAGPGLARVVDYGAVDATPLFVMLLGELRRWGLAPEVVERLLPHADRALSWIVEHGDLDGDGYVEYRRATDRGQRHQAWKDSPAPVVAADGSPARGPIAVAEVQGYAYAAFRARAHFATEAGDRRRASEWQARATSLRASFNLDFWVEAEGWPALALDGDGRAVAALASNVGHLLWTGILDEERAAVLAKHLVADDLFSGWGVRTLAASMPGYDPLGLHTGAVWPHDTALCVAGLVRYGLVDEAHRLLGAQLEAAAEHGGRPRVLCGFDRDDIGAPVAVPDTCAVRAWSAAAPLLHLRSILRLDPNVPQGRVWLAPVLPPQLATLRVDRIPLLGGSVSVAVEGDRVEVDDLPAGIEVVAAARPPVTPLR
ncbi:MAG TPA: glycogen debranching N-terminal domain-containing protein [Acidimicrobiales bacterium]|nr:glycogen debranching N-terminal domain-containing protein [Acidimicrobiales bacterium]